MERMEEEEGYSDEGPTIEEIINAVVKRKSKFGMCGGALPSRPSSAVKNKGRESSSSPEDQVPKSRTLELKSCFPRSIKTDVKTSSNVLGVLHDVSAVNNNERLSPANQEKDASDCPDRKLISSLSNHKMQRSLSTPDVKCKFMAKPPMKLAENCRATDNQQINCSRMQGNQVINKPVAGDENKRPNAASVEIMAERHKDTLKLVSKPSCQGGAISNINTDHFLNTKGKGEIVMKSNFSIQNTVPTSRPVCVKPDCSNKLMENERKPQQQKTNNGIQKREFVPDSNHFVVSDTRPSKIANTTHSPYKTNAESLKTSPLSMNSQQVGHSRVMEAHQVSGMRSQCSTPVEERHTSKSSTVTGNRLTAPGIPQINVESSQIIHNSNATKEACLDSAQNNVHSQPITFDNGYVSGNVSVNVQASNNSQNGPHTNQHSTSGPHLKPRPPTPPSNHKLNMDHIVVKGQEYLKLGILGRGGSSKVYEVLDLESRKVKAMKVVELEGLDKATLESYKNEIDILQRLQWSDRVIRLYDFEQTGSYLRLVMEKGNQDMASILSSARGSRATPLSPFTIKHYWHGMLQAVQAIHNEGIIHCDLKPANFVLVNQTVKLIDFGIASSIQQDMTSVVKDSQAGTFNYMSPESLRDVHTGPLINNLCGDKVTIKIRVKSDVWSLGCILYNLVYGRTPFQHISNPLKKLAAISDPNTEITFKEIEDKHLMDVMRLCLTFDSLKRPTIDQLLQHPYLTDKTPYSSPKKPSHLKSAIDQLAQLTPNSLNKITSMLQQMKPDSLS